MTRELFEHLDVAHQTGPGEASFEEVVAEQGVLGDSALQRRLEGIDLIDPLAGIGPFAEQVLVQVTDCSGVGVDPARGEEDALEIADSARSQEGGDSRLQDSISLHHPPE